MPDPSFVNFIGRCLEWDPKKRLTPDEGLQHEWIIKGLPPNIILHNPHNNPYARKNNNSSNSTNKNFKPPPINHHSGQKSNQQIQIKRQQSAHRRSRKAEASQSNANTAGTNTGNSDAYNGSANNNQRRNGSFETNTNPRVSDIDQSSQGQNSNAVMSS